MNNWKAIVRNTAAEICTNDKTDIVVVFSSILFLSHYQLKRLKERSEQRWMWQDLLKLRKRSADVQRRNGKRQQVYRTELAFNVTMWHESRRERLQEAICNVYNCSYRILLTGTPRMRRKQRSTIIIVQVTIVRLDLANENDDIILDGIT